MAISSAIFQSVLDRELRKRVHGSDAHEVPLDAFHPRQKVLSDLVHFQTITRIRQSARLVISLPPDLQRDVRDSYDIALKRVFMMATCSTLLAYIVRLGVSPVHLRICLSADLLHGRSRRNRWMNQSQTARTRKTLHTEMSRTPPTLFLTLWEIHVHEHDEILGQRVNNPKLGRSRAVRPQIID